MKIFKKILKRILVGVAILAAAIGGNQWMNRRVFVNHITIESADLPKAFEGFRILQLTDIHSVRSLEQLDLMMEKVKQEAPDLIVVTGDLVDSYYYTSSANELVLLRSEMQSDPGEAMDIMETVPDALTLQFMEHLLTVAPVYMVYGNHEMVLLDDPEKNPFRVAMEEAGVVLLNHEKVHLEKGGDSLWLTGVQDPIVLYKDKLFAGSGENNRERLTAELDYVMDGLAEEDYVILLSHRPEYFELYAKYPVDLAFTGHAHGGQVRLPLVGGLYAPGQGWFPKYTAGFYEQGNLRMVTGRGIGNSKNLTRVFNPPEMVVVELENM